MADTNNPDFVALLENLVEQQVVVRLQMYDLHAGFLGHATYARTNRQQCHDRFNADQERIRSGRIISSDVVERLCDLRDGAGLYETFIAECD